MFPGKPYRPGANFLMITYDFTLPMLTKSGRSTKTDFKNGKYCILLATGVNNKEPHGPDDHFYELLLNYDQFRDHHM